MSHRKVTKIFNDPVHGHIELPHLCVKIIDTPQFQRLKFIKQLGAGYFVFPGASHNRFEHSLGVCHLAGELVKYLQHRQTELKINKKDVLCVQIAGLCHDLGHGPFSHVFNDQFLPHFRTDEQVFKREEVSIKMFDHLLKENDLEKEFTEKDKIFIKEMISGPLDANENDSDYNYKGRDEAKRFLYEIVANKRNGIDVDKWDYLARDCHMLGIRNTFDHDRLMKLSRVIKVDGKRQICFRKKEAFNLYEMFHTRSSLHRRAYQHTVTKNIETMITDALVKANGYIEIPGKGEMLKMSKCVDDMAAYTNLTDEILQQILHSTNPKLEKSKTIINNVLCRNLYKCAGESRLTVFMDETNMEQKKNELLEHLSHDGLFQDDIHVHVGTIDYGKGNDNPMQNVLFYEKTEPDKAFEVPKSEVSKMLPEKFAEQIIRVFCKHLKSRMKLEKAASSFKTWCSDKKNGMKVPEPISVKRKSAETGNAVRSKRSRK